MGYTDFIKASGLRCKISDNLRSSVDKIHPQITQITAELLTAIIHEILFMQIRGTEFR